MIKKSLSWLYSAATYLLWAAIIIATLLMLGLRYLVLPEIDNKKDEIALQASKAVGLKITIGGIKASWESLRPHIDLFNVDIYDAQNRPALTLGHIEAEPSWLSLVVGEVRLAQLVVHQPTLTARREKDGTVYVAGISMSGPSRPEFPNWLLRQSRVDVLDATVLWQDDFRGAPPLALEKMDLRLTSPIWESVLDRHHFGLHATPSAGSSKPIDIRGLLTGADVSKPQDWEGTIYTNLEGTDLAAWSTWITYPFDIRQGYGAAQLWLEFSNSRADAITADVVLNDVVARLTQTSPVTSLRKISGRLDWKRLPDGQEVRGERLSLEATDSFNLQNVAVMVRSRQVGSQPNTEIEVNLDDSDLGQFSAFAATLPQEQPWFDRLREFSPRGRVQKFHLNVSRTGSSVTKYGLGGRFSGLGINAQQGLPGFSNLTGTLEADQDSGTLTLDSRGATIDLSNRLSRTILADKLAARMNWTYHDGKLDLKVANLDINGPTIVGAVNGGYLQAKDDSQSIRIAGRLKLLGPEGFDIRDGGVRVNIRQVAGKAISDGEVSLDDIRLEQVAAFAATLPLEQSLLDTLRDITPRGRMQQLRMNWAGDASGLSKFGLRSRFSELGMHPYLDIPGFAGLTGSIDADQDGGTLQLDANKVLLDPNKVLRWPIPENKLAGEVQWTRANKQLKLTVDELSISNPHLAGVFSATYQYSGSGSGSIDLTGKITRADGKSALFYYPKVLSQDTLHWLDTSVLAGTSKDVAIVVKGNLDEFPWVDNKRGLFQIKGVVTDGVLDYADNWPRIEGIRASLLFQGKRMELNATQGRLLGNQITQAKAVIPDLDALHPVLKVTGELQSPAEEAIKYINKSPLLEATDRFTEHMQASGNGKLLLDLEIPLDTEGVGSKVKGSYQVSNGRLAGNDGMPTLENINGRLDFTESSLRAKNVSAQVFGGPTQFNLESGAGGLLHISAQARLNDSNLRQIGTIALVDQLHGTAQWNAEIDLHDGLADVSIRSSLVGMASSLPEPFNKSADSTLPLMIEKKAQSAQQQTLSANLGSVASARLLLREQSGNMRPERGEISFGGKAEIPAKPGIGITGNLTHVDFDQWQALAGQHPDDKPVEKNDIPISYANLTIGKLDVFDRRISALKLNANAITDGWKGTLQSYEVSGDVQLLQKAGRDKLLARLKLLSVPPLAPAKLSATPVRPKKETEYPSLDIVAEEFNMPDKKLGKLEIVANPNGNDWDIEKLIISNPDSTLSMNGKLQNWKSNPATSFNLTWDISDIGKTMERYGKPDAIRGGKGTISGQLKWPGPIHAYDASILDGTLDLTAEKGQILKINPGVGRLFSILSLQNLPRRLTFDFRDVFSEGFSFDKIDSRLIARQGVVQIDKFQMDGPVAKVEMKGETNLVKETQNLHVKVTPAISDSLSLAAFAGGPAVGAAAWLAQKILRGPADKLAAYEFDVTGTWADPQEVSSKKTPIEPAPGVAPFGN